MNTELIQQLAATSDEARQILEKEYPNEFRKSGWYVDSEIPRWLGFRDYENNRHYGFDALGCWYDYKEAQGELTSSESLAPLDIVQKRLIEEAKMRGYGIGVACLFGTGKLKRKITRVIFDYDPHHNRLDIGSDIIFDNGRWAEIVPKENPIEEPETQLSDEAKADELYKVLSMCGVQTDKKGAFAILKAVKLYEEKGMKATLNDTTDIITETTLLFDAK